MFRGVAIHVQDLRVDSMTKIASRRSQWRIFP